MSETIRYSDVDLAEFKAHIEQLIVKGNEYLENIQEQVQDARESKDSEGDWMDDTSTTSDLEMLYTMESRQVKHLNDLNNALLRIMNKSYGICIATGELIDKRRLMAVPTTTRSMQAKMAPPTPEKKEKPVPRKREGPNEIITKVIKKAPTASSPKRKSMDDDDLDDDDLLEGIEMDEGLDDGVDFESDDDSSSDEEFDFDSVADEGGYDDED